MFKKVLKPFTFVFLFLVLGHSVLWSMDDSKKQSISEVLYETINEQGIDAAVKQYHNLKKKQAEHYDFQEAELNTLGYRLLGENKNDAAIAILNLNTEAYPNSPNTYDSLAEAYMRSGEREKAIKYYEKTLAMLPDANLDQQNKDFLKKNAESRLSYLRDPESRKESTVISDFIADNSEHPFGKLHPDAPPETRQFGQLAGVWECMSVVNVNGQWVAGWPSTWVWRYILGGFAVQDIWFQAEENLPPPRANLGYDLAGTNVRIFLPARNKWEIAWFANGKNASGQPNNTQYIEAEYQDEQIIMHPKNQSGDQIRRIVFHNITEDSFDWKSQISEDDGETWQTQVKIEAKRLR